jgi:sulfur-carrier protein
MGVAVYLSGHLTRYTSGEGRVEIGGSPGSVARALDELWVAHPALRDRVLDEQGRVRQHVLIFLGTEMVDRSRLSEVALPAESEVHILPAVSGG